MSATFPFASRVANRGIWLHISTVVRLFRNLAVRLLKSLRLSVCTHETIREPLEGFSLNMFEDESKFVDRL